VIFNKVVTDRGHSNANKSNVGSCDKCGSKLTNQHAAFLTNQTTAIASRLSNPIERVFVLVDRSVYQVRAFSPKTV